jgi:hypothetical protein
MEKGHLAEGAKVNRCAAKSAILDPAAASSNWIEATFFPTRFPNSQTL